jgi:hypothetical protein
MAGRRDRGFVGTKLQKPCVGLGYATAKDLPSLRLAMQNLSDFKISVAELMSGKSSAAKDFR